MGDVSDGKVFTVIDDIERSHERRYIAIMDTCVESVLLAPTVCSLHSSKKDSQAEEEWASAWALK